MTYRLALFGASPDTPNMGVSALFASAVEGLSRELGEVDWVIFDNGLGRRTSNHTLPDGAALPLIRFGARAGRRYHRPENLATMQLSSQLGALGARINEAVRLIDSCDAVLDVSGGDSFSDIYGLKRFRSVSRPKQIALSRGKPLILLPQTYGPYRDQQVLSLAEVVTRNAAMTWARDPNSFATMKQMLASRFNPAIHRQGVDMAFSLVPRPASQSLPARLATWLAESPRSAPLVGINVSGLIYNDPARARSNYHFVADYREVVNGLVGRLLGQSDARVILVSHVMDQPGHYESDLGACQSVADCVTGSARERVMVAPVELDQSEAKWLIASLDWFCGTRMHSTIAGLSSGVPTSAIAYSDKTLGVFDTCGQAAQVFDPRKLDSAAVIDGLWHGFQNRQALRESLAEHIPRVRLQAAEQMRDIAEAIRRAADKRGGGH